jgi:predicted alpha/beta-hydrolase family hydrolase
VLLESWQQAIERAVAGGVDRRRLLIGGKSLGGRMASNRTWEQNLAAAADAVRQFVHGLAA